MKRNRNGNFDVECDLFDHNFFFSFVFPFSLHVWFMLVCVCMQKTLKFLSGYFFFEELMKTTNHELVTHKRKVIIAHCKILWKVILCLLYEIHAMNFINYNSYTQRVFGAS